MCYNAFLLRWFCGLSYFYSVWVCILGVETHSPFLLLLLGNGDKWSSRQLFLDAIHPTEGKRSNIHCIVSGRICWKWHNFCRVKKTSVYTELSNSIRPVIFRFWVIFNFHIKIDRYFFFAFLSLLNYENMITLLPETWKKQNRVTYSSTQYYDYFLSR